MSKIFYIIMIFLFSAGERIAQNTVSYMGITCRSSGDVGVALVNKKYECVYLKEKKKKKIEKRREASQKEGCPTEITQIFHSKASGIIETCKGKLLLDGQKSRIVKVYK